MALELFGAGVVAALVGAALMPLWLCARRGVRAWRAGQRVWPWGLVGLLCLPALAMTYATGLGGLWFGVFPRFVFGFDAGVLLPVLLAAVTVLAGPWSVWWLGRYTIDKAWPDQAPKPPSGALKGV